MLDSEKALADLAQKKASLIASCVVFLEHIERLDCCVQDIDDPFVAFTMMDTKQSATSFVDDFIAFLGALEKSNNLVIDQVDRILRSVSPEPES